MKDIVTRIRERFPRPKHSDDGLLANEAADEIERLKSENSCLRSHLCLARSRFEHIAEGRTPPVDPILAVEQINLGLNKIDKPIREFLNDFPRTNPTAIKNNCRYGLSNGHGKSETKG